MTETCIELSKLLHRFHPNFAKRRRPTTTHRGWSKYTSNKSKMADAPHFENREISIFPQPFNRDFDKTWHDDVEPGSSPDRQNLKIEAEERFRNERRSFLKLLKCVISSTV